MNIPDLVPWPAPVGWRSPNWPYLHPRRAGDAEVVRAGKPPELQVDRGCRPNSGGVTRVKGSTVFKHITVRTSQNASKYLGMGDPTQSASHR